MILHPAATGLATTSTGILQGPPRSTAAGQRARSTLTAGVDGDPYYTSIPWDTLQRCVTLGRVALERQHRYGCQTSLSGAWGYSNPNAQPDD